MDKVDVNMDIVSYRVMFVLYSSQPETETRSYAVCSCTLFMRGLLEMNAFHLKAERLRLLWIYWNFIENTTTAQVFQVIQPVP